MPPVTSPQSTAGSLAPAHTAPVHTETNPEDDVLAFVMRSGTATTDAGILPTATAPSRTASSRLRHLGRVTRVGLPQRA